VAYTALEFVQLAGRDELGIVTQFDVKVTDAGQLEPVAAAIDELFATAQEPTTTYTEQAFIGKIAGDIVELVGFARWLGLGCLAAVLALVGNAIVLSVQSRVAEHAVLQTLGYSGRAVAALIVGEGVVVAVLGGLVGAAAAIAVAQWGSFALTVEGQSIGIQATPVLIVTGLLICGALGVLAGLVPAWQASRREIAACFRTV
jgi:putative ABC transport system permease protein